MESSEDFEINDFLLIEKERKEYYVYFWDRLRHITENNHIQLFKGERKRDTFFV